jgi:hypothetical protein
MNTSHNGTRLGQALYKICDRLGIVHKVSFEVVNLYQYANCDNYFRLATLLATMRLITIR